MFTGIIEAQGKVSDIIQEGTNLHFFISAPFVDELKVDQSVAHNGVCLTVADINQRIYKVTAIKETLDKTNLGKIQIGDMINLERCMPAHGRFDGHIVQGHVDTTATCVNVTDQNGSWEFDFECNHSEFAKWVVTKGSICVNGISLTVASCDTNKFRVAIIPYTFEHTNLNRVITGSLVNIEFDILGKYVAAGLKAYADSVKK